MRDDQTYMTLELHNLSISSNGILPEVPFLAIKEKILGKRYELSIAFVPAKRAQELNIVHRGKDYIPNTLSFSLSETSGEIVLCMSALRKQHAQFDMDLHTYIIFILIHSMLHLIGMEHGGTMDDTQQTLLTYFTKHENSINSRH